MCVHGLVISGSESLRLWCHYWVSNIDDLWEIIVYNLSQSLERARGPSPVTWASQAGHMWGTAYTGPFCTGGPHHYSICIQFKSPPPPTTTIQLFLFLDCHTPHCLQFPSIINYCICIGIRWANALTNTSVSQNITFKTNIFLSRREGWCWWNEIILDL